MCVTLHLFNHLCVYACIYLYTYTEEESDEETDEEDKDGEEMAVGEDDDEEEQDDGERDRLWDEFCKHMMERFLQVIFRVCVYMCVLGARAMCVCVF